MAIFAAGLVAACGGGEEDHVCHGPTVTSTPPTLATVGTTYIYSVEAPYSCVIFILVPGTCLADVELLQGPSGAQVFGRHVNWTPTPQQANTEAMFVIATNTGRPCHGAAQSWTVHVNP